MLAGRDVLLGSRREAAPSDARRLAAVSLEGLAAIAFAVCVYLLKRLLWHHLRRHL